MSKIICEICGTTYADTEQECPLCGFEKPETAEFAPDEPAAEAVVSHGKVKGGRFSASNAAKRPEPVSAASRKTVKSKKKKSKTDLGLLIAVICLLLAIAATVGFIYFRYFKPASDPAETNPPIQTSSDPQPTQTQAPTQTQGTTVPEDLSCTGLTVYEEAVSLNQAGSQWLLNVVPTPSNTTDVITYTSSNDAVATVSADGKIVAVGNGEATITITCGTITAECKVICNLAPVETQPQETKPAETKPAETKPVETKPAETKPAETKPAETKPAETKPQGTAEFKFNSKWPNKKYGFEVTFYRAGETWKAYAGDIDPSQVTWSVKNTSVARVSKAGKVTAVGSGDTVLTAVYNGVEYTCLISCEF